MANKKLTKYLIASKSVSCDGTRKETIKEKIYRKIKKLFKK